MSFDLAKDLAFPTQANSEVSALIASKYVESVCRRIADGASAHLLGSGPSKVINSLGESRSVGWVPEVDLAKKFAEQNNIHAAVAQLVIADISRDLDFSVDFSEEARFCARGVSFACTGQTEFRISKSELRIESRDFSLCVPHDFSTEVKCSYARSETSFSRTYAHEGIYCVKASFPEVYPPRPIFDPLYECIPSEENERLDAAWDVIKRVAPNFYSWMHNITSGIVLGTDREIGVGSKIYPGLLFIRKDASPLGYVENIVSATLSQYLLQLFLVSTLTSPDNEGVVYNAPRNKYWTARKALVKAAECAAMMMLFRAFVEMDVEPQYSRMALSKYSFIFYAECADALKSGVGLSQEGKDFWRVIQEMAAAN
ncbi:hypothetical protein FZ025_15225 [Xanthomonas hyacinthi]|uniref:hypothetical protein n=1 Tax=Xanthomonas hyacinthi TaxID=56455 RepID=UPI000B265F9B|nr:hypothetical protein [Xanthomonas hyacinthi]QGY77917.1 hypothetical protein FZ025_15225 [Xanthomonas hyacinthi]